MGQITTHILDTAEGCPGRSINVRLFRHEGERRILLREDKTQDDGRCASPLADGAELKSGTYCLEFDAGAYFRAKGIKLADPPFLDVVCLRFGISDPNAHYHVPLLLSPYGYTTYRGS